MTPESSEREGRNRLLVEWSTAVFAIFWSVWWASTAESVLDRTNPLVLTEGLALPRWFFGFIAAVYVALFTYSYIKWMWEARTFYWDISVRSFVSVCARLPGVVVGLLVSSLYLYIRSELSIAQFVHGATLTCAWIVTMIWILLSSENWI